VLSTGSSDVVVLKNEEIKELLLLNLEQVDVILIFLFLHFSMCLDQLVAFNFNFFLPQTEQIILELAEFII